MAEPIGQLAPGTKCDRYDVVRLIGAGGMGEVYQAMHEFTKKPVALKVLKVDQAAKQHHVEKMRAEAMVLCRIRHQNLVEVYDAGFADVQTARGLQSLIWMAMDLLEGESLRERIVREGAVRPALALEWAAQVADGTQVAHDNQIIHRDLKPENIFITKKGDVRVLDFGTAKFEGFGHRPTLMGDRVGTIPYMSPEHIGGEELDGRSDIYALGVILYEMLAGRHPFSNAQGGFPQLDRLLPMVLAGEPESLEHHVGPVVWQVVTHAVHKEREGRFPSMAELARAARRAAATYGTDASGVALRLSGSSAQNAVPLGPMGADASTQYAQRAQDPALFGNLTPPPLAAGIPAATPRSGVTSGPLAAMALLAAALGAGAVVLVTRPTLEPPIKDDVVAHPASESRVPDDGPAGDASDHPADEPSEKPAGVGPTAQPPTDPPTQPPSAPPSTAAEPVAPVPAPAPIPRTVPGGRRPPPPTPAPPQPPKRPCNTGEIIPRPCN